MKKENWESIIILYSSIFSSLTHKISMKKENWESARDAMRSRFTRHFLTKSQWKKRIERGKKEVYMRFAPLHSHNSQNLNEKRELRGFVEQSIPFFVFVSHKISMKKENWEITSMFCCAGTLSGSHKISMKKENWETRIVYIIFPSCSMPSHKISMKKENWEKGVLNVLFHLSRVLTKSQWKKRIESQTR